MRLARITRIGLFALVGATIVTLSVAVVISGWRDTREQVNRSVARAEVSALSRAPWLLRAVAPSATRNEQQVWRFLLGEFSRSPRGKPLVVGVDRDTRWPELARERAPNLYERLTEGSAYDLGDPRFTFAVHEFIVRNSQSADVSKAGLPTNVRVIPLAKFTMDTEGRDGWEQFVKRNGAVAYISFSRVGFTPRGDRALVYVQLDCGVLCGHGAYYMLEHRNGQWRIVTQHVDWVS